VKLSEALAEFDRALVGEVKDSTRQWYLFLLSTLPAVLGDIDICDVDASALRRWRLDLFNRTTKTGRPYSADSKNNFLKVAKRFFKWAKAEKLIKSNPTKRLKYIPLGDREPRNFSLDDFKLLLNELAKTGKLRNLLIPLFLLGTGCRIGGLCGLRLGDIDMAGNRAYVREKGKGHDGKGRWVYLDDVVRHTLYLYLATERPKVECDALLVGKKGQALATRSAWYILRNAAKKAGIKAPMNPHSFRHTAAKLWLESGASLSAVSAMLGHSSIQVTDKYYTRYSKDELKAIHGRVSPVDSLVLDSTLLDNELSKVTR
jgi:integrase/recombinase XerD